MVAGSSTQLTVGTNIVSESPSLPPSLPPFLHPLPLFHCPLSPALLSPCTAFFELVDRGMGIVSLHSYLYPGYRLRIVNFVMGGKVCVPSIQNKNIVIVYNSS